MSERREAGSRSPGGWPTVAVVIIAWNRIYELGKALESVKRQTVPTLRVVCVDNGSTDGSPERFREMFPAGVLVQNPRNLGFAHAANQGIEAAGEVDYVLLLNQDVMLDPDYVRLLLKALESDPGACGATGLLVTSDGLVDSAGHVAFRDRVVEDRHRGLPESDLSGKTPVGRGFPARAGSRTSRDSRAGAESASPGAGSPATGVEKIFGISAAAALYRVPDLRALAFPAYGLSQVFDRGFFSYLEDVDLDFRANLFGRHFLFVPAAKASHRRGSTGRPFAIRWRGQKNYWLVLLKHDDWASILPDAPEILLFLLYRFLRTLFTDPLMIFADFLAVPQIPKAMAWRRFIARRRKVSPSVLRRDLLPGRLFRKLRSAR